MTHPERNSLVSVVSAFLSNEGVTKETRLLLGVSGGLDSMVLLRILYELHFNIAVSHINFNLRGRESDEDASLVRTWCKERSIPFYILNKITKTVEAELGINTQTAARRIRYHWWDKLAEKHHFEFVCTAHHLDDSIETLLLNLFRGTGTKGLRGIPAKRGIYLRPLLGCPHHEIVAFAEKNQVPFRTDSSNLSDDYQRNRLRHHIMPLLQEMYPGIHSSMAKTIARISREWETYDAHYEEWIKRNIHHVYEGTAIELPQGHTAFALRWLEAQGVPWTLLDDYIHSDTHNTGLALEHGKLRLSRTDSGYFLETIKAPVHFSIDRPGEYQLENGIFSITRLTPDQEMDFSDPWMVYINSSVIKWPLAIRPVEDGDVFQPFGMEGKHKKLQDFMVDLKLEMFEKRRLLVLENEEHILWVIGKRLDERARVDDSATEIYQAQFRLSQQG